MYSPHSDTHSVTRVRLGWTNLGREEKRPSSQQMRSSSGGVTFENALSVQHVSRDNHCVEALGEPRSAGGFEGLARPTPLRNETRRPVKKWANWLAAAGSQVDLTWLFTPTLNLAASVATTRGLQSDHAACWGPGLSFTVVKHPTGQRVNTSS